VLLCAATVGVSAAMRDEVEDEANVGKPAVARQNDAEHSKPPLRRFSVRIRAAAGPPRVATALQDAHGASVTVACSTCHSTRPPNPENRTVNELDEFHGGMAFSHGTVSCLSCHNSSDYDSLKLADGRRIEFSDVMTLCGQCHGPQLKDYQHGAHGGMNGYWDLTRGPRIKNNCVDCHLPHAPQFPKMQPTFKPRDRFLEPPRDEH
jgi:formate-dependent nitrite reductase cytochrome c552 subunit